MTAAARTAKPALEDDRLAALHRYHVLDTPHERAFDRIVQLAALLLDVPIALISLIDAERQWFKARYGLDALETPRALAFCDHAVRGTGIMVVPDAEKDQRFRDNPLVTGDPHIRFYAGAPLVTPDGYAIGTICTIDRAPRQLRARDAAILTALGEQVVHELEVRAALGDLYREVAAGQRLARTLQGEGSKLEALLNATKNAVVTADDEGNVASLNRVAEAMFGFEPGEGIGWPMVRLISLAEAAAAGDRRPVSEGTGRRKNGTEFPIEVSRATWTDLRGIAASGAVLRDITERRHIEAELRRRAEADQMQEKLAALGQAAGGVAHELNNLLQPVIGLSELELDAVPQECTVEQAESRENLATIRECGVLMRSIVRKILIFARKTKPDLEVTDFPSAVVRTLSFVGKLLPADVDLHVTIEPGATGMAAINEPALTEVLTNLAVNAADAMDRRGRLSILLERVDLIDVAAGLGISPGPYFRLSVSDTGKGMDSDTRARIFEPFFTTKEVGQGTGLGLSMAYGVLRDWNGAIDVDTAVGRGSTFKLYVPAVRNS
jgi:PAS domain S-box-containing protein